MSVNNKKTPVQDEWETVHIVDNNPGVRTTERLKVPDGWLYLYREDYDGGVEAPPRHIRKLIYVPEASGVTRDRNTYQEDNVQPTKEDYDYEYNSDDLPF